jgi:hypothetical protein
MKTDKKKGKRGRPRKNPITEKIKSDIKRGRGRPPKSKIDGMENIDINKTKGSGMSTWILSHPEEYNKMCVKDRENIEKRELEEYIEPKIYRKTRVFRFDRSIFHAFSKKFKGNIIEMSYVANRLMEMYINKKIKIENKNTNYGEWCKGNPPLEPVGFNDLAQAHAVARGIPLQYKYSLIIDEEIFWKFEKDSKFYPQFIMNQLVKTYLDSDGKISIDIRKANGWMV